jgi:ABC-type methionine transport system permease subunit
LCKQIIATLVPLWERLLLAAPKKTVSMWISHIVLNILRTISFIILMIVPFPFTRPHLGVESGYGASPWSIYCYIWIPEACSSLIRAAITLLIAIVGFSAIRGFSCFQRFDATLLWGSVILLIVLIEALQLLGNYLVRVASSEGNASDK